MTQGALVFRELHALHDFEVIYPLANLLAPDLTREQFAARIKPMVERGYRCLLACDGTEPVGMAAWWIHYQLWCGKFMEIDNVVVSPAYRGKGLGEELMQRLEEKARQEQCELTLLKVYAFNRGAQRFYFQQGYVMPGQVFVKPLSHSQEEWSRTINRRYSS